MSINYLGIYYSDTSPLLLDIASTYQYIDVATLDDETILNIVDHVGVLHRFGNFKQALILQRAIDIRSSNRQKQKPASTLEIGTPTPTAQVITSITRSGKKPPFRGGFGDGGSGQKF